MFHLHLKTTDLQQLEVLRTTGAKAYLRERADALLRVARGSSLVEVAHDTSGRKRKPETVAEWIGRFQRDGLHGLEIRPGRGRKRRKHQDDPAN